MGGSPVPGGGWEGPDECPVVFRWTPGFCGVGSRFIGSTFSVQGRPAFAGRVLLGGSVELAVPEDPRSCGADTLMEFLADSISGRSPLLQGVRRGEERGYPWRRATPAPVGRTNRDARNLSEMKGDARTCGARVAVATWSSGTRGRPLRLRGAPRNSDVVCCSLGLLDIGPCSVVAGW